MSEWKPIETAPRNGTEVLVWTGDSIYIAAFDIGGGRKWWVLVEFTVEPTHWQPLPTPPTQEHSNE